LLYYKDELKAELLGLVDFEECFRIESAEAKLNLSKSFEVGTTSRTYYFLAETEQEATSWMTILRQVMHFFKPTLAVQDAMTNVDPKKSIMEGWLSKQGGNNKTWKNRWFVLRETSLVYFANSTDSLTESLAKGVIPLEDAQIQVVEDHKFSFCFAIAISTRSYLLIAKDRPDLDKWTHAITTQISKYSTASESSGYQPKNDLFSKYQTAMLDKWNTVLHSKPTFHVGAELSRGGTSGYLLKASKSLTDKSGALQNWKQRFFVLQNYCLYYFKTDLDDVALGTIELGNTEVEKLSDNAEASTVLSKIKGQSLWDRTVGSAFGQNEIDFSNAIANKYGFVVKGRTKKYFLLADSEETSRKWLAALKDAEKEWIALIQKTGIPQEKMNKMGTIRAVQKFIKTDERTRAQSVLKLPENVQQDITSELSKALKSIDDDFVISDSSDDSSGDESQN
jgi:hypothetical protein